MIPNSKIIQNIRIIKITGKLKVLQGCSQLNSDDSCTLRYPLPRLHGVLRALQGEGWRGGRGGRGLAAPLHEVELPEVELQDGVFDSSKHEADVLRVRRTREVRVDDFLFVWILILVKFQDKVFGSFDILLRT